MIWLRLPAYWLASGLFQQMAGNPSSRTVLFEGRLLLLTPLESVGAAGMKRASAGPVHRAGDITTQYNACLGTRLGAFHTGIGLRNRGEQRLRVRMPGMVKDILCGSQLDDLPQVHHSHAMAVTYVPPFTLLPGGQPEAHKECACTNF